VGVVSLSMAVGLAAAPVSVRHVATNVVRTAATNQEGSYTILSLPPGQYEVTAHPEGFKGMRPSTTLRSPGGFYETYKPT